MFVVSVRRLSCVWRRRWRCAHRPAPWPAPPGRRGGRLRWSPLWAAGEAHRRRSTRCPTRRGRAAGLAGRTGSTAGCVWWRRPSSSPSCPCCAAGGSRVARSRAATSRTRRALRDELTSADICRKPTTTKHSPRTRQWSNRLALKVRFQSRLTSSNKIPTTKAVCLPYCFPLQLNTCSPSWNGLISPWYKMCCIYHYTPYSTCYIICDHLKYSSKLITIIN